MVHFPRGLCHPVVLLLHVHVRVPLFLCRMNMKMNRIVKMRNETMNICESQHSIHSPQSTVE
jgi:hypothetical protein